MTSEVTAIVLNYGASLEILRACVASVADQCDVLLVDNASPRNREALDSLAKEFPALRLLRLDRNCGFAGGMNRGVAACASPWVLLLNNDLTVAPGAVAEMLRVGTDGLESGRLPRASEASRVAGVAPKILLSGAPGFIDAVGTVLTPRGVAMNRGLGQLDVGQYDRSERTFGACFAAALLKREALAEVGPLEERFFMYYEDVDWCLRAGVLGRTFLTAPAAVVHHHHSLSTRDLHYAFKHALVNRNFLWLAARDFQLCRALRAVARRQLGLLRGFLAGPHRQASFLALLEGTLGLPRYLLARRALQRRRRTPDRELLAFAEGERVFFDGETYAPRVGLEALAAMYRRKAALSGDERHRRIAEAAAELDASLAGPEEIRRRLEPLIAGEGEAIRRYVAALTE